ncbi:MAG: TolC family protein, partial [Planctomycetes bacterium]|nr:TolC family protein [Planctomycetota bacterium]
MGLLQTQMQIDNLEDNVNALRNNLRRLIAINEGAAPPAVAGLTAAGVVSGAVQAQQSAVNSQLQIAQARQALVGAESQLLRAQTTYQRSLDQFKETLGLPPQVCIRIEDPMFDEVDLIDRLIRVLQVELNDMGVEIGDTIACLRVQLEGDLGDQSVTLDHLAQLRAQLGTELHPQNLEMLRDALVRDYDVCESWCPGGDRRPEVTLAQTIALLVEGEESAINRVSRDGARLSQRLMQKLLETDRDRDKAIISVLQTTLQEEHGRWPDVLGRWLTLEQVLGRIEEIRSQMAGAASLDPVASRAATREAATRLRDALADPEVFPSDRVLEVVMALEQEILLLRYVRGIQEEIEALECLFIGEADRLDDVRSRLDLLERHLETLLQHRERLLQSVSEGRAGVEGAREKLVEAATALEADLDFPLTETISQMLSGLEDLALGLKEALEAAFPWLVDLVVWRNEVREARIAAADPCAEDADELDTELELLKRLMISLVDAVGTSHAAFRTAQCRLDRIQAAIVQMEQLSLEINMLLASGMTVQAEDVRARFLTMFDAFISPAIPSILSRMSDRVLDLSLVQAGARTELVELPRVNLDPETALEIARANRRDWMNSRAALVDAWRLIEFNADDLESTLDVIFTGDVQNEGDRPFALNPNTGRLRVGLQWDAPLVRLQERNTYRQALIEYQQARREYYLFVDSIAAQLRDELRTLRLNRENFRLRREALRVAREQILLNQEIQTIQQENALSSGPTTARDAVSALSDLLQAQNDFLDVYVNYEVVRRSLDFDLGTMMLRPDGVWIDPGPIGPEEGPPPICLDCGPHALPMPLEDIAV